MLNEQTISVEWENNLKRLYTVWFHLYNILWKTDYTDGQLVGDCLELGMVERKGVVTIKE